MFETILKSIHDLFHPSKPARSRTDIDLSLTELAQESEEQLNWRASITDLLKLLKLDSTMEARSRLWKEFNNADEYTGTAGQNMLLQRQVMERVASDVIKLPESEGPR